MTLLEMSWRDLRGWIETGEVEGIEGLALPWAELISFGMEFWSQEVVEEALGADLAEALPELLRLTELEVRIPRIEVVALERLAALDGETVSAVLARELRDLVSVYSEWLSQEVPGFAEALAWPETPLVTSPGGGERPVRRARSRPRREARRVAGSTRGPMTQDRRRRRRYSASPRLA